MKKFEPIEDETVDLKYELSFLLARRFGPRAEEIFVEAIYAGTPEAVSQFTGITDEDDLYMLLKLREAYLHGTMFRAGLIEVRDMLESDEIYNKRLEEEGKGNA